MLSDSAAFLQSLISFWWSILDTPVPGMTFTYKDLFLGLAVVNIGLLLLRFTFGVGHYSYRSGGGGKAKVSNNRRNDQK